MAERRFGILDAFFLLLLIGITLAFYQIITPFILDIFLAVVFANVFRGLFIRLEKKIHRNIASGITVIVAFFVIAIPVALVAFLLSREIATGWPEISRAVSDIMVFDHLREIPLIGQYLGDLEPVRLNELIRNTIQELTNFLFQSLQKSFVSFSTAAVHFLLVLFLMFFLFLDGNRLLSRIKDLIPLNSKNTEELIDEAEKMVTATLISTIIIGFIEGTFGGILFFIFGLPSPVLWGIVIMFVSMIPIIGTNFVIIPAAIIIMTAGNIIGGMILIILGLIGVAVTQNLLKPKLLGNRSGLHPGLVLLSILGGIAWIGVIGFLVGPLLTSLFIVIWNQFGLRYRQQLEQRSDIDQDSL